MGAWALEVVWPLNRCTKGIYNHWVLLKGTYGLRPCPYEVKIQSHPDTRPFRIFPDGFISRSRLRWALEVVCGLSTAVQKAYITIGHY
jgi:hypothetical protein